ncbi:MAG: transcription termination factor Rho [Peptoniphilaceae bacterium]|nr:transcription termination factor Rho [Peptoniphilaceae bacterium]MDY6019112.1 transcription termination factor Rho [Anaerococcus sp.]
MQIDIKNIDSYKLKELKEIAKDLGIKLISQYKKKELIDEILKAYDEKKDQGKYEQEDNDDSFDLGEKFDCKGILDLHEDGFGFLRTNNFEPSNEDIYVSPKQVKMFRLKTGDFIKGIARVKRDRDKFPPLIFVSDVNGLKPGDAFNRSNFDTLTPIYPKEKLTLETGKESISQRIIDVVAPIGKGQRGLIVSQPKAGKTTLIKDIELALEKNYDNLKILVLLIDERPEEVTDFKRFVNQYRDPQNELIRTEVAASTFDQTPQNHINVAELVVERAKRLVEDKKDVVILLDSITRLSRAHNIMTPQSGRTLSGGLDPLALVGPKKFFGAARNIEDGGSLTIIATSLVDTGSRMDDMIYEEFKGTGNMEIHLSRDLAQKRVFPAIDIEKSSTRKEELLLSKDELDAMYKIRRRGSKDKLDLTHQFIDFMRRTKSNKDFISLINKTFQ